MIMVLLDDENCILQISVPTWHLYKHICLHSLEECLINIWRINKWRYFMIKCSLHSYYIVYFDV